MWFCKIHRESAQAGRGGEDCFILVDEVGPSPRVEVFLGGEQVEGLWGLSSWVWECSSRTRKLWVHGGIWIPLTARKQKCALTVGAIEQGNWISKDVWRRALHVKGTEQREYRAETKSLGGQKSSAVALTVGAAKARAHWEAGLLFCYYKGRMFLGRSREGEIRFHCWCDIF